MTAEHLTIEGLLVEVELTDPGTPYSYRSRYGRDRSVKIGRVFTVRVCATGETIGTVRYRLQTHETRSKGNRYVNARWQSPGWDFRRADGSHGYERESKRAAITSVVNDYKRGTR